LFNTNKLCSNYVVSFYFCYIVDGFNLYGYANGIVVNLFPKKD